MIRVFVADDHALVRRGVRAALRDQPGIEVVGEAATGAEVQVAMVATRPDVLILDISMPGTDFLALLDWLRDHEPRVRTLVVSAHAEAVYARRAIRAGAAGYLTKGSEERDLVEAIRQVARGQRYVGPTLAQELAAELATGAAGAPHRALSPREHEIFLLLLDGHTVSAIAGRLGRSVKTISTHRTNLLAKLGLGSNADLVRYGRSHGLLRDPRTDS